MSIFLQLFFTVLLALLVGSFFYYVFKYTGPWGSFWTFILVLIFAGFAASVWIEPFGPPLYNVAWAPILIVILLFALFLAAASPPRYRRDYAAERNLAEPEDAEVPVMALSALFWIFLVGLLIAAIMGVLR
jgi:hypothetical protein